MVAASLRAGTMMVKSVYRGTLQESMRMVYG